MLARWKEKIPKNPAWIVLNGVLLLLDGLNELRINILNWKNIICISLAQKHYAFSVCLQVENEKKLTFICEQVQERYYSIKFEPFTRIFMPASIALSPGIVNVVPHNLCFLRMLNTYSPLTTNFGWRNTSKFNWIYCMYRWEWKLIIEIF